MILNRAFELPKGFTLLMVAPQHFDIWDGIVPQRLLLLGKDANRVLVIAQILL